MSTLFFYFFRGGADPLFKFFPRDGDSLFYLFRGVVDPLFLFFPMPATPRKYDTHAHLPLKRKCLPDAGGVHPVIALTAWSRFPWNRRKLVREDGLPQDRPPPSREGVPSPRRGDLSQNSESMRILDLFKLGGVPPSHTEWDGGIFRAELCPFFFQSLLCL